jgi:anti-sigma factor RsiW
MENFHTASECREIDIAAYIDGELDQAREMELEVHFSVCEACRFELNEQKRFLSELDATMNSEPPIELPANFAKVIVANAESNVSGIRRPAELYNALFICAALSIFVLFALGPEASAVIAGTAQVLEQAAIVAGFFGHLIYSLFLGIVIVMRSLSAQVSFDALFILAMPIAVILSLTVVSKRVLSMRRA